MYAIDRPGLHTRYTTQVPQARVDALSRVILARAFRGRLVLTEAELARREGRTYEPASVLLERIKAERAARGASTAREGRRGRA